MVSNILIFSTLFWFFCDCCSYYLPHIWYILHPCWWLVLNNFKIMLNGKQNSSISTYCPINILDIWVAPIRHKWNEFTYFMSSSWKIFQFNVLTITDFSVRNFQLNISKSNKMNFDSFVHLHIECEYLSYQLLYYVPNLKWLEKLSM